MSEPTLYPESGFLRLRIDLAYDGTNYSGWAKQPDRRTIQEEIEKALSTITQTPIETIVAGRTDAGVHATGQVIHFDMPEACEFDDLAFKLNCMLDEDIRILKVSVMTDAFHARFSPTSRSYTYTILDANQVVAPLHRLDVAPWYRALDINLLNQASSLLLGEHDFAAFCKFREGATTVRTLMRFNWIRDDEGYVIAEITANAFCYSMVRNLVGAVVCVAEGRNNLDWIVAMLANKERVPDSLVFVARGLTLRHVEYPGGS
ncbi:MAG: tRNA pseudouridine(38-40) synthase TruA [Actinomycetes bacterium]|jgi:tRNA pseudouridine38-40 synthase